MSNTQIILKDLESIDYKLAWKKQEKLFDQIVTTKQSNEKLSENEQQQTPNYLLFCEHPHVYTLGKSGEQQNLLIPDEFLKKIGATFYKINRGGDITYHGPGQLVGYPIFDMDNFKLQVKSYIYKLEEVIIRTLNHFAITASRLNGATGVWLNTNTPQERKICAIGVRTSRWVTMHGFALNVSTNLDYFNYINPCGFTTKGVTSMEKELGQTPDMTKVKQEVVKQFKYIFTDQA